MELWSFQAMTFRIYAAVTQSLSSTIHEHVVLLLATLIALDLHLAHVDNFMNRSFQVISTPPLHLGYARMAQVKFRPSNGKRASWVFETLGSATDFF
jgi:hypothetical protein